MLMKIVWCFMFVCSFLRADFLEQERENAIKSQKLIVLSVTKEQCPYCLQMRHDVFETELVRRKIDQHYLHVEVDKDDKALPKHLHVKYYPTNLVLNPKDLSVIDEFIGYTKPDIFVELLEEVYKQEFNAR